MKITKIVRENKIGSSALVLGLIAIIIIPIILINTNPNPNPDTQDPITDPITDPHILKIIDTSDTDYRSIRGFFTYQQISDTSYGVTCTGRTYTGTTSINLVYSTEIQFNPTQYQFQFRIRRINTPRSTLTTVANRVKVFHENLLIFDQFTPLSTWTDISVLSTTSYSINKFSIYIPFSYNDPVGEQFILDIRTIAK